MRGLEPLIFLAIQPCRSFLAPNKVWKGRTSFGTVLRESSEPLDDLSDERKANLFQFLLRDLQVEGVPLLAVDADQVHTLQAAIWTTLAELQSEQQKACLIFEAIPTPALRSFVDDFLILKTQDRLMEQLPEIQKLSLLLVGKGVGPAILVEVDDSEDSTPSPFCPFDENVVATGQNLFVERIIAEKQIPHFKGSVFRSSGFSDACHILSAFWNCVCESMASQNDDIVVLSLPAITDHSRFSVMAELMSRSLCLYRGDDALELFHTFPDYNRDLVFPKDQPAHGHLPPMSWIPAMANAAGTSIEKGDVPLINYMRRSPVTSVCIAPVELLETGNPGDEVMELELDDGTKVLASGIDSYTRNLEELVDVGWDQLDASVKQESGAAQ